MTKGAEPPNLKNQQPTMKMASKTKYLLLLIALPLAIAFGCNAGIESGTTDAEVAADLVAMETNASSMDRDIERIEAMNKRVASELYTQFNAHAWDQMAALYAEPCLMLDPHSGTSLVSRTKRQVADDHARLEKWSPNIQDSVLNMISSGDQVVVQFVSKGTTTDSVQWMLPICSVLTFKEGLIVKDEVYYDRGE